MADPRAFSTIVDRNVPCTLRDGTVLYADVFRPAAEGRFPVLLTRTPYDKTQPRMYTAAGVDPIRSVGEGYVVIYQDVRGRFSSQGEWSYEGELDDGYDSVEWAAALPCSDGNVGMFGISYLGLTQWMAAAARPPHLKAIFPQQIGNGGEYIRAGGTFNYGGMLMWAAQMGADRLMRRAARGEDVAQVGQELLAVLTGMPAAFDRLPISGGNPVVSELFPAYERWIAELENTDFWRHISWAHRLADIDVPVFSLGGWHDIVAGAVPELFAGLRNAARSESMRGSHKLLIGPWVHGQLTSDVISDLYMGLAATAAFIDLPGLHLRWFDHWLKGKDTGFLDEPPVRLFVMGDNVWRHENEWPLARTQWTPYYLHSNGHANTRDGDGRLHVSAPTDGEPADTFTYDPANPVPTVGGPTLLPGTGIGAYAGPKEQSIVEARPDVLVYTSETLDADVEVTGPVVARLFASTSARDTDWTVRLVDVHPDGRAYGIADGIVRARYRLGPDRPQLIEPGTVTEFTVDLQATSNVFKRGHRIRVQVSSSNFPAYARNPNTGTPIASETRLERAHQTVFHAPGRESHILLPIIPR